MKSFIESGKFKVLVVILAILLGMMIAAVYNEGSASLLSNAVGAVTTPLQKWSSSISNSVSEWLQKFTDYEALFEENQQLKIEARELRERLSDYNTVKHENEQYSKIIDNINSHKDWKLQAATVIARDTQSRFYSFTIDKGTLHGVNYLDPIMSADGLVGHVSEVGLTYAKVVTLLDTKTDVGVYDSEVREIGVLNSSVELAETGNCVIKYLERDSKVVVGDMIFTSGSLTGGRSIYPRDIYVGKVVSVELDEHKTNLQAIVQPVTDVSKVKDVFVITDFEGKDQS